MSSNGSGKRLERFFTGKGFYIVLFLCAAVIGVSAWMMAAGNETMAKDVVTSTDSKTYSNKRVETVIIPPAGNSDAIDAAADSGAVTAMTEGEPQETADAEDGSAVAAFAEDAASSAPVWLWPVSGSVERGHRLDRLSYDVTMRDWRTHDGVDIDAPEGSTVTATRGGIVESVISDDLYGTVVTIDHGDGSKAVYANLAESPAVSIGDAVEPGYIVGAVGTTALAEVGQESHLHFAIKVNGLSADPLEFLSAA